MDDCRLTNDKPFIHATLLEIEKELSEKQVCGPMGQTVYYEHGRWEMICHG